MLSLWASNQIAVIKVCCLPIGCSQQQHSFRVPFTTLRMSSLSKDIGYTLNISLVESVSANLSSSWLFLVSKLASRAFNASNFISNAESWLFAVAATIIQDTVKITKKFIAAILMKMLNEGLTPEFTLSFRLTSILRQIRLLCQWEAARLFSRSSRQLFSSS